MKTAKLQIFKSITTKSSGSTFFAALFSVAFFLHMIFANPLQAQTINYDIRLNQIGYYSKLEKKAYIAGSSVLNNFSVQSLDHATTFYTAPFSTGRIADFSAFTASGEYVLYVPGVGYSAPFKISTEVFKELSTASLKGYYFKRASTAITAEHGGVYARKAGHPDTQIEIHSSAASPGRPAGTLVSAPKGWYDAGDYNCYVVNSNITTYTLLAAYEHFQSYYDTLKLNIPESGNSMPDILDEIKWNLDWMFAMQDPYDGGVYDKKTTADFSAFVMPEADQAKRYMVGKSAGATFGFAAVMAVAYRVYLPHDAVYANKCLAASKKAFACPSTLGGAFNPTGISTGIYNSQSNEKAWAGVELYISTKDDSYYVPNYNQYCDFVPKWYEVNTVGLMSLVHHRKNLTPIGLADTTTIKNKLLSFASATRSGTGYIALFDGEWGSNSFALNAGMMDMCAYMLTKDRRYLNSAIFISDHVLGKNGAGYCFVTSFGSKKVMHPHDRISGADGIVEPVPGWVSGGGASYVDEEQSYTTNEVAINWNAPLVFLSGGLQYVSRMDVGSAISVFNGTTLIPSNYTPALSFGSSVINTVADKEFVITIKNSENRELVIQSITPTAGFSVSALSSAGPIAPNASATFTIKATPKNLSVNTGTITIQTNDKSRPEFVLNVSVKGKPVNDPLLQVYKGTDFISSSNTPSVLVGSAPTGSAASPVTITLLNEGTSPLTIQSITSTSGFIASVLSPVGPIAPDASATFTVTATPANNGSNAGTVTIKTNDAANPTYTLNVSANGLVPLLSIEENFKIYTSNGDPYYFGTFAVGQQSYVGELKIRNSGTARLILTTPEITGPYSLVGMPEYLEAGEVKIFGVIFSPTAIGTITGTVTFRSNAGTPFVLNLSGRGKAPDPVQMRISQGSTILSTGNIAFKFPATVKGTTSDAVVFTITNTGTAVLPVTNIQVNGPFQLVQPFASMSIPVGSSTTFEVVFKPTSSYESGSLQVFATGISSFYLPFSGEGTEPSVPKITVLQNLIAYENNGPAFEFPTTILGVASNEVVFTIKNTGDAKLFVSSIMVNGPFELVGTPTSNTIEAGASETFSIVFKPINSTDLTGSVVISNNATVTAFVLNLSGTLATASEPVMKVTQGTTVYTSNGSALEFPATTQGGTSSVEVITIANTGNAALVINDITLTGPFELTQTFTSTTIAAGSSKTFSLVFKPISSNTAAGNAIISSNTAGSVFVLNFSGTGTLATGTVGVLAANAVLISPNPSKDNFSVQMNGSFNNVSVNIYTAIGELVTSTAFNTVTDASFPVTLNDAAAGIYIIEIITDQGNTMKRIIKE